MDARLIRAVALCAAAACGGGYATENTGGNTGGTAGTPVAVADFSYTPTAVSVKVNESVAWTNHGQVAHTVTADGGSFDSGQMAGETPGGPYGGGAAGGTFARTFTVAGAYPYHCNNHPGMTGTVTVTP